MAQTVAPPRFIAISSPKKIFLKISFNRVYRDSLKFCLYLRIIIKLRFYKLRIYFVLTMNTLLCYNKITILQITILWSGFMFFGRERELASLNNQYTSGKFEFPVVYGRRRVGKTQLIQEFIKDKRAIYVQGVVGKERQNLNNFSSALYEFHHGEIGVGPSYNEIHDVLLEITRIMKKEKIVLVIDEYPFLAESIPVISSMLQMYIDHHWKDLDTMLILCGSSMSFIEKQVLSYASPLYGRWITPYKLFEFTFNETRKFLGSMSDEDVLAYYAITNGIPFYLTMIDPKESLSENINRLFLESNARLLEEPINLLNMEVREPSSYMDVLTAIAAGASKTNEIATKANLSQQLTKNILNNLIELRVVEKITPTLATSRKPLYVIKDNLYRFWFTFIAKNVNFIRGAHSKKVESIIMERLSKFLAPVFEHICREWLLDVSETDGFDSYINEIGAWWGGNPKTKQQEEIDIIATTLSDELFLGECKWREKPVGVDVMQTLVARAELFPEYENKKLFVFAKENFSDDAVVFAKENEIRLVAFKEMMDYYE